MPSNGEPRHDVLREALGPTRDCPPAEELARLACEMSAPADLAKHVETCAYCQTEVRLARSFQSAEPSPSEAEAVRQVTARLRKRSGEIFAGPRVAPAQSGSWWRGLFAKPWLSPALVAMAALLVVVGVGVQSRRGSPPSIAVPTDSAREVLRSNALSLVAPAGDVQQTPKEIQWQPVAGAAKYEVRLLEVDHTEMWNAETSAIRIDLPAQMQSRIVPAKTILCQVSAFDAAGRKVAESEFVRFRLLQNIYSR